MRFADLLALRYDKRSGIIDHDALRRALPHTPDEVIEQFYADHGRKDSFKKLYAAIQPDQMAWTLEVREAGELIGASMNPDFRLWFTSVGQRVAGTSADEWKHLDGRPEVEEHWRLHQTRMVPPVLIDGALMGMDAALHLVEGYTRLGLLAGPVRGASGFGIATPRLDWPGGPARPVTTTPLAS